MIIWLPTPLYHFFPMLCVIVGFVVIMFMQNLFGVLIAACLYIYSYSVLWLRQPIEEDKEN